MKSIFVMVDRLDCVEVDDSDGSLTMWFSGGSHRKITKGSNVHWFSPTLSGQTVSSIIDQVNSWLESE